MEVTADAGIN